MRRLLVTCFICILGIAHAQQDTTGSLRGFLLDKNTGEPLPFCNVFICNTPTVTLTDINGFFAFNNLSPGTYDVASKLVGYTSDTLKDIVVQPGGIANVKLWLHSSSDTIQIWTDPPYDPEPPKIVSIDHFSFSKKRGVIIGSIQTSLTVGSLIALNQLWYKQYPRSTFHAFNDNGEWMQMDKIGHMQSAYAIGQISTSLWWWTGMKYKRAVWLGGLTGLAFQSGIEVMDGYSVGWGFSIGDMIANTAGSALFISQQLCWNEQRIVPKFGFRRSGLAKYRPEILGSNYGEQIIKDYNGQTYWLSVNVASFLREDTRFPKWLNVAFGYGANGMTGGHANPVMYNAQGNEITLDRYRQYYLSFDIDLHKLPVKSRFLHWVFNFIGFIKIPAPGIELSEKGVRPLLFAF